MSGEDQSERDAHVAEDSGAETVVAEEPEHGSGIYHRCDSEPADGHDQGVQDGGGFLSGTGDECEHHLVIGQ